jgi:hypothetical protein
MQDFIKMMNDKHISQWAEYIIEEFPNRKELEKVVCQYPELEKVFIAMYKKGCEDAMYEYIV